jgi:hypothetical protein
MGLQEHLVNALKNHLSDLSLTVRQRHDSFVVSLEITNGLIPEPLYALLADEAFDGVQYSVWASVVTSSDHGGVSLPSHILDFIRLTQSGVDFSFVACLGEYISGGTET